MKVNVCLFGVHDEAENKTAKGSTGKHTNISLFSCLFIVLFVYFVAHMKPFYDSLIHISVH